MSTFNYRYGVGSYRAKEYQIGVRAEPEMYDSESFAVVLFYTRSDGEYVEVAKIDDSEHEEGTVHFDRHYRADGANRKDFDVAVDSLFEAEDLIRDNWRRYARLYEENHERRD